MVIVVVSCCCSSCSCVGSCSCYCSSFYRCPCSSSINCSSIVVVVVVVVVVIVVVVVVVVVLVLLKTTMCSSCLMLQTGQVSAVECQEIRKALEDGALDVLAPASAGQKDVVEFRERVLHWSEDFDQHVQSSGRFLLHCFIKHLEM